MGLTTSMGGVGLPTVANRYVGSWYDNYYPPREIYRLVISIEPGTRDKLRGPNGPFYPYKPKYAYAYVTMASEKEMGICIDASIGAQKAADFAEELLRLDGVLSAEWEPYINW